MDDEAAVFVRGGLRVLAEAVSGAAARDAVVDMRQTHYQSVLDGLGVPTWDESDFDGTHFLCSVDGVPVASMRSACVSVHDGEVVDLFPDLATQVPVTEFVYLSRQLVVPDFRRVGLSAVLVNAAADWWLSTSTLRYAVASSRASSAGNAVALGGRILAPPAVLGPEQELIFPVGGSLRALADRTRTVLERHDWKAGN
jgi:GNAT superfamily N-acetyltransferase